MSKWIFTEFGLDIVCEHNLWVLFLNRLETVIEPIKILSNLMYSLGRQQICPWASKLACIWTPKKSLVLVNFSLMLQDHDFTLKSVITVADFKFEAQICFYSLGSTENKLKLVSIGAMART